jgi:hypothetical protein
MSSTAQFVSFGPFFSAGALVTAPKLYHYVVGTTTDKDVWTTRAKSATAAQPVVGDANGVVSCYADGIYKMVIKDSADNTLYTWDNYTVAEPSVLGSDWINVLYYGAIGDGVTNDTMAIQAAIDAAEAAGGGVVYCPAGLYKITATLTMGSDVTLVGAGRYATRLKGNLTSALLQSPNTAARYYRWGIHDMGFDNTAKTNAGGIALDLTCISHAHVSNVEINNVETGVLIDAQAGTGAYYNDCYSVAVSDVVNGLVVRDGANDNRWFGGRINACTIGIDIDDCARIDIYGVSIEVFTTGIRVGNAALTQYVSAYGVRLENTPTSGTGISLSANAQTTAILNPMFTGLTTAISDSGVDTIILSGERGGASRASRIKFADAAYSTSIWAQLYAASNGKIAVRNATDSGYAELDANTYTVRLTSDYSETTDPAALGDTGRVYCKDNGAGKTQLCVRFATGAVQVIATEP